MEILQSQNENFAPQNCNCALTRHPRILNTEMEILQERDILHSDIEIMCSFMFVENWFSTIFYAKSGNCKLLCTKSKFHMMLNRDRGILVGSA